MHSRLTISSLTIHLINGRYFVLVFILQLFLVTSTKISAQVNLVPNPSFEIISQCPNQLNQVYLAQGWDSYGYSPDYYNSCFNINWPGVGGYQTARTGNGYIGCIFIDYEPNSREEFFGIQLTHALQIGIKYYVSYYLNCGGGGSSHLACNKQGVLFSTIKYDSLNVPPVNNFAHIVNDSILTDSINWFNVRGSFVADSNYTYLIIGNFFLDSLIDTIQLRDISHVNFPLSYYFVDDVCVSTDSLSCYEADAVEAIDKVNPFMVFPNPSHGYFQIRGSNYKLIKNIKLYDLLGREQPFILNPTSDILSVTIQNAQSGYYFLCFESENKFFSLKILLVN